MGLISKPYTFSAGAAIIASEHNDNFDTVYNLVNGNITNDNVNASAAIVDTKLAQITSSDKVHASSLVASSEAQGTILYFNGSNWVILAVGTDGQVLETNGAAANPSWSTLAGDCSGSVVANTVTDLTITSEARGDILRRNASSWGRLAIGTTGQYLTSDGTDPVWAAAPQSRCVVAGFSGDITSTTVYAINGVAHATQDNVSIRVPFACTAKNLYLRTSGGSGNHSATLYKNGVSTALTASISGSTGDATPDTSNAITLAAGDKISFNLTTNASNVFIRASCELLV